MEATWRQCARPLLVLYAREPIQFKVPACAKAPHRGLGGRSTVGHGALDAVIGVRIPASQPDFARLRRASSGQASPCHFRAWAGQASLHWRSLSRRSSWTIHASEGGPPRFPQTSLGFAELRLGRRVPVISELGWGRRVSTGEVCPAVARGASEGGLPITTISHDIDRLRSASPSFVWAGESLSFPSLGGAGESPLAKSVPP